MRFNTIFWPFGSGLLFGPSCRSVNFSSEHSCIFWIQRHRRQREQSVAYTNVTMVHEMTTHTHTRTHTQVVLPCSNRISRTTDRRSDAICLRVLWATVDRSWTEEPMTGRRRADVLDSPQKQFWNKWGVQGLTTVAATTFLCQAVVEYYDAIVSRSRTHWTVKLSGREETERK